MQASSRRLRKNLSTSSKRYSLCRLLPETGGILERISMLALIISILVLVADQASKGFARHVLKAGQDIPILGRFLQLTYLENTGAAFGILQGRQGFFLLFTFFVLALLVLFYWRNRHLPFLFHLAMGLILGGAVGNLIDRIRFSYVVDFIRIDPVDFYHFPIFNVADLGVSFGVLLLAYLFLAWDEQLWEGLLGSTHRK